MHYTELYYIDLWTVFNEYFQTSIGMLVCFDGPI